MKESVALINSLLTFTSALTALSPRDTTAILTITTGDGDSATTLQCTTDQVCVTVFLKAPSVQTSLNEPGLYYAGFKDSAATQLIQPIFNSSIPAPYEGSSTGSTASVSTDAINIGSYFCSASKAAVQSRDSSSSASSSSSTAAPPPPPPPSTPPPSTPPTSTGSSSAATSSTSTSTALTVRVQLEQSADQFVQVEIPSDAIPVATASSQLITTGLTLSLVSATDFDVQHAGCQLFSDAAAKQLIGLATVNQTLVISKDTGRPRMIGAIAFGMLI